MSWRETVDENRFAAAYADYSMSITRKGDDTCVLSVHNRHGTVVDSIDGKSYLGDEQTFEMLKELFPLAQRTGVAAIEALDELLKEQSSEEVAI